jgi:hypothetical protein
MICEKCNELGLTSKLFLDGGCSVTCIGINGYYDDTGKYHYHDSNITTISFKCSNGHYGTIKSTDSSSCGCVTGNKQFIYY